MRPSLAVPVARLFPDNPRPPKRLPFSTIAEMALRNLSRHRRRTIVNVIGIGVTVGALLFFQAFYRGSYEELMFGTIIDYQSSHILVQNPAFVDEDPDSYGLDATMITDWAPLCDALQDTPGALAAAPRLVVPAFAGDGIRKRAVLLAGIDQACERKVLRTLDRLSAGQRLSGPGQILIGASLARLFGLQPGDQLRVQVTTVDDVPNIQSYTITGLFTTGYSQIDRGMAFAALSDVQEVMSAGNRVNRILVRAVSVGQTDKACAAISEKLARSGTGGPIALPWTVPAAGIIEHSRGDRLFMVIFLAILFVLAVLTVTGTMYTAVFERTREIGTLRAMGWHRPEVFRLFVLEAALIGAAGTVLGIALGGGVSLLFGWFPIDMAGVSESLDVPFLKVTARLDGQDVAWSALAGVVSAMLAGITPARRASRMQIVKALAMR